MPKPSEKLVRMMRDKGFVPSEEAVRLTGHGRSTIGEWGNAGLVKMQKSGLFRFYELAGLRARCPQLQEEAAPARKREARS